MSKHVRCFAHPTLAILYSCRRALGLFFLVLCGVAFCNCSYRLAEPAPLGEDVRIVITVNEARVVRIQPYLQAAVAAALENKLGWRVRPSGSAKLELTINEEKITSTGTVDRNLPARWSITVTGQALLTSRHGNTIGTYTGTGYASGLNSTSDDEPSAVRAAADAAATTLTTWLQAEAERWPDARK